MDIVLSHKDIAEMGELMVDENEDIVDIRKYGGRGGYDLMSLIY